MDRSSYSRSLVLAELHAALAPITQALTAPIFQQESHLTDRIWGIKRDLFEAKRILTTSITNLTRGELVESFLDSVRGVDPRLQAAIAFNPCSHYRGAWIMLNPGESYDDFKFIIGKLLKIPGLTLDKADQGEGWVSYSFTATHSSFEGELRFSINVTPGEGSACAVEETEEPQIVKVRRLKCGNEPVTLTTPTVEVEPRE